MNIVKIYETIMSPTGKSLNMQILHINKEYADYLLSSSGEFDDLGNQLIYTKRPVYLSKECQESIVFYIINKYSVKAYNELMNILKVNYAEVYSLFDTSIVVNELNKWYEFNIDSERLYPKIKKVIHYIKK